MKKRTERMFGRRHRSVRRCGRGLLAAVLGLLGCAAAFGQEGASVEDLTRAAQIVFQGTVQKVRASNLAEVPASEKTIVVRIDDILEAPYDLGDFTGREVTVWLDTPRPASPGDEAVFFTRGWFYGETLGVVEVGRTAARSSVRAEVAAAAEKNREKDLAERIARAELVVAGKVLETREVERKSTEGFITEHDPEWREAVIQVVSVLKGRHDAKTLVLFYPASDDVMWADAPKPRVGQDRVWLLHTDEVSGQRPEIYTALKPGDVLPRSEEENVRRLVKP